MSFQIMTDTASDLSFDYYKENKVFFTGFTINMNNREYRTDVEGEIDPDWFLESLQAGAEPTTSQVNVGKFLEIFTTFAKEGQPVLYIAFSSGLSGTFNSSLQARDMLLEDFPHADVRIFDTRMASGGQALFVEKAVQMKKEGKPLDEIVSELEYLQKKVQAWVTVDDLHHLVRGGRLSKASAIIGTLASIKPILDVDLDGKLRAVSKVRGRKKSISTLVDLTLTDLPNPEEQIIYINYSGDREAALSLKEKIQSEISVKDIVIHPLGPTIATHTGYGCVAVFSIHSNER
ncbi:MAG: DegV family protein [Streptococcaceae bacterium]|jgi:DegV family protein with EDD domain|nr:DegV family protein [Streptococcaceae bacterium]